MPNYFQTMLRGECVIIEYEMWHDEIDYALITNHNEHFIHPNYEYDDCDSLWNELFDKVRNHVKRIDYPQHDI